MHNKKSAGIFFLALPGAIIAAVCDGVHVYTQTLSYPVPFLFGQAWWVFPGFLMVFLLMGHAYAFMAGRLPAGIPTRQSTSKGSPSELVEAATAFAFVYLLSGFGNFNPVLLSVVFYGAFAVRWFFSYDRSWLLLLSALMAFGGMAAEGAMSAAGWVTYRHVDVFHVPFWLGGLYLHGAFALREGMRYFVYSSQEME
jgi:hypothetical protein